MAGLDYLFNAPPASVTGNVSSVQNVPDWLQEYERAMAGKATEVAGQGYQPYPGQQVAGFNNDQMNAFQQVRDNQGSWQPGMGSAMGSASGIADAAQAGTTAANGAAQNGWNAASGYAGQSAGAAGSAIDAAQQGTGMANAYGAGAVGAVAGPSQSWTNNYQQYMSPYTQSVVDEIGRQGNLNLQQNILPGINSTFGASGQFGSGRNAAIVGQGISQAQQGISGLQSQALQSGYGEAANIFGQDANRAQQQQQMQSQANLSAGQLANSGAALNANTALSAAGQYGNLGSMMGSLGMQQGNLYNQGATINSGALDTQAQRMGALTQLQQGLQNQDTAALGAVGGQQQALQQQGDTAAYNDFLSQRNYDWQNLANMNSVIHGLPMSTSSTQAGNTNTYGAGQSPLGWLSSLYGAGQAASQGSGG